jgi:hypothetical protein
VLGDACCYKVLVLRPESKSLLEPAWLLSFLGVLICGMDALMDAEPFPL